MASKESDGSETKPPFEDNENNKKQSGKIGRIIPPWNFLTPKSEADSDWDEDSYADEALKMPEEINFFSLHTLIAALRREWKVFLALMLAGAVVTAASAYIPGIHSATAVMSLNYEESKDGRNPNGTRFSISEIRSRDVAEKALRLAGLSEKVDPQTVIDSLSVSPYTSRRVSQEEGYYISSSYNIHFKKPLFGMHGITTEDMLSFICKAYKENFYDDHIISAIIFDDVGLNREDMDYSDISEYFVLTADRMYRYLDMRINEAGSYSDEYGKTFKSLRKRIINLKDFDLKTFESYIWENGIAEDKNFQIEKLNFLNHSFASDRSKLESNIGARLKTIDEYNEAMTSSILIPSYDKNYEFYMSRTKTGIDDIAKSADSFISSSKDLELKMTLNYDKMAKLYQPEVPGSYETASQMVSKIEQELISLGDEITEFDNAYVISKTRDFITFDMNNTSFISRISLKRVAAVTAAVFLLTYAFFVWYWKRKLKKNLLNRLSANHSKAGEE